MAFRTEIQRALNEMISDETGKKFQGLAVLHARQKWPQLMASERNRDLGLDAYASGDLDPGGKGIGLACSITATIDKVQSDATKVKKNFPDVRVIIFSTAGEVTEYMKRLWAEEILDEFGLKLVVVSQEEFIIWLQEPANANICRELGIDPPITEDLEAALERSREAAKEIADNWDRKFRKAERPVISLSALKLNEHGYPIEAVTTESLNKSLAEGQRIILEAPAGNGKTTTLVQLVRQVSAAGGLALLVDLPAWVLSGKGVLSYIAELPEFASRDVDAALLSKLRGPHPPIFLLNGWNEVSVASVEAADAALRELDRSFPGATIIVATRIHRFVPQLRGALRVALSPLRRTQRDEYLHLALGESAHGLQVRLDNSRVLDSITRTPLFLAEVVDLYRSGKDIPLTKMGVLGAVMDSIEQSAEHRNSLLHAPLGGNAAEYLRSLSMEMTDRGETTIAEADARATVNSASARLLANGQIVNVPDPAEILDELSKRHVLVRDDDGNTSFRLQHQQFQEFFAAGGLRARLIDLTRRENPQEDRKFLASCVNEPRWGESLRMLAEDIGESAGQKAMIEIGAKLVRMALEVDPIFASEIARWCGKSVWNEVRNEIGVLLRTWHDVPDPYHKQCALAAMLATGSADFKDIVVPLLTNPNSQIRTAVYHTGVEFLPSSLGEHWEEVVSEWTEEARLDLILQLAHDPWLAETVEQLALADPSPKIKWNAARLLSWYGFTEKVAKLLSSLDDANFQVALHSLNSDEIPPSLWPRAIEGCEARYAETGDVSDRLRILWLLQAFGGKNIAERLGAELEALDEKQLTTGPDRNTKWALEELRKSDSEWVSDWVARKVLDGYAWFRGSIEMVIRLREEERESLLTRFSNELLDPNEERRLLSLLGATADREVAARVLERACEIRRGLSNAPGQDMPKWNLFRQQINLLEAIPPKIFLEGLSHKLQNEPEATELDVLTNVLGKFGPITIDVRKSLPDDMRQKLHAYLNRAAKRAADPEGVSANVRAHLALLLAQVGGPNDVPDLRRLIGADSIRWRGMWAARMKGDRSGDNVSYALLYIGAVTTADPERADDVLLELLDDQQYERFAGEALVRMAWKRQGPPTLQSSRLDFGKVWTAREGKGAEEFAEERRSRYSDAIRVRVQKLLNERDAAADKRIVEHRLKPVAGALAALDARRSAKLVLEVMAFPGNYDGYTRVASLESLILAGVSLTLAEIMSVLGPTIEELRRDLANNDQNRWLLQRCLSLLAFAEQPAEGIAKIREILSQIRLYELEGIVTALGVSRCAEAMDLLLELAKPDGSGVAALGEQWIKAVAQLGGERSDHILLSFVDPNAKAFTKDLPDHREGDLLAQLLADRAKENGQFKAELFRLASGELPPVKRMLLAKTFARFQEEANLVAGLCVLRDDGSRVPYDLLHSIENAFLERRPYGAEGHAYTIAPRGSNAVRKRLFEMAQADPDRKHSAFAWLGQIEVWRLEYGRPTDEPRHPAIESGAPWPLSLSRERAAF